MNAPSMNEILIAIKETPGTVMKGKTVVRYRDLIERMGAAHDTVLINHIKLRLLSLEKQGEITLLRMDPPNNDLFYAIQIP